MLGQCPSTVLTYNALAICTYNLTNNCLIRMYICTQPQARAYILQITPAHVTSIACNTLYINFELTTRASPCYTERTNNNSSHITSIAN